MLARLTNLADCLKSLRDSVRQVPHLSRCHVPAATLIKPLADFTGGIFSGPQAIKTVQRVVHVHRVPSATNRLATPNGDIIQC